MIQELEKAGFVFSISPTKKLIARPYVNISKKDTLSLKEYISSNKEEIISYIEQKKIPLTTVELNVSTVQKTLNSSTVTAHNSPENLTASIHAPSNHLSCTLPGTGGVVESITAVIDGAGLTKLSKWIKPTSNNPTGINLNLKLVEQQKGGNVTKPVLPVPSIISSSNSSVESFIADVEKAGVSLAYADERLQIDASRLMETPTGSADLSSIIEKMKVYMSANKDEILKYLQSTV